MKNKITKFLSLIICICLLCTMIPVHAADSNTDASTNTNIEETLDNQSDVEPVPQPLELKGSMYGKRSVLLKWNSDNTNAIYNIYRSTSKDSGFELIDKKTELTGDVKYYNETLTIGTTYYYYIEKELNDEIIATSNTVSVRVRLRPVENITVSITSSNKVKLTWDKASYATSYAIYRSTSKDGEYEQIGATSKLEYTDADVISAKAYYYKIYSWKKGVSSARSLASEITPAYTKTKKPVVSSKYSSKKVTLSWSKVTRAEKYYIYRRNSEGTYKKIGETTNLKYTDENISAKKRYFYKVRGVYKKDSKNRLGFLCDVHSIYTAAIDPDKKMVAITFDDGPGPHTKAIVNCLKENNARATFFVVGERIDTYDDELAYTFKYGNEIANHTYSHPNLTKLSKSKIQSEISKTDKKVQNITGVKTALLRTPGGATNATVKEVAGKPIIFWSIDTLDWKHKNASKTVSTVLNNVKDGDIILMHDIHKPTKEAALELIPKLKKKGYQIVTVSELAQYRGYKLKNGTVYSSLRQQ